MFSVVSLYAFQSVACIGSTNMLSGLDGGHAKLLSLLGGKNHRSCSKGG